VVEDVGREEIDEMPRPLRSMSVLEDLWFPFTNIMGALMLCYLPAILVYLGMDGGAGWRLFACYSLLTLGTILLPAVSLTLVTSGSLANLRPDRVLGVIQTAGVRYIPLVLGWVVAITVYVMGVWGFNRGGSGALFVGMGMNKRFWALSLFLLMLGIYLMHAWCWQLGLFYRAKNASFPWVLQRHERKKRKARKTHKTHGGAA
jgi:hypothetical protein